MPRPAAPSRALSYLVLSALLGLLAACSSTPPAPSSRPTPPVSAPPAQPPVAPRADYFALRNPDDRQEVVMFALGLLDTRYVFGGRNPEAGLDCSGMVSYVVEQVSGQRLPHNAAKIAEITRPIASHELRPGDLLFFNTSKRRHSHMGIYLGNGKFVHAPSSRGQVRVERMDNPYFSSRLDGLRALAGDG